MEAAVQADPGPRDGAARMGEGTAGDEENLRSRVFSVRVGQEQPGYMSHHSMPFPWMTWGSVSQTGKESAAAQLASAHTRA